MTSGRKLPLPIFRRRLTSVLVLPLVVAPLGCGEHVDSPTAPESSPALSTAATQVLLFSQTSAGTQHTCGVTTGGQRVYCWGSNFAGQLGDGTDTPRSTPVPIARGLRFRQISAGAFHTCGVTTGDLVYCWGSNQFGQLGDASLTQHWTPTRVAGVLRFRQVSAGQGHSCGVTTDDRAYCWGSPGSQDTDHRTPAPVGPGLRFREVSAASHHTCGVSTSDQAYCWGGNFAGQLGDGSMTDRPEPVPVAASGLRFHQVSAGGSSGTGHTCGLTTGTQIYCWGENANGQLGDGTTTQRLTPVRVARGLRFVQVEAGGSHSCGVTTGNRTYCWGRNAEGQLGDGSTTQRMSPVLVQGGRSFRSVTAADHTCSVTTDDRAFCWGSNNQGQLGDGTLTSRSTPVAVAGAT